MKFANPLFLWALPILLLGGAALFMASRRMGARKLAEFGPADRLSRILRSVNPRARLVKFAMVTAGLALLAVAAARPMVGPRGTDAEQTGTEFFIVLDVSKSMLVRDAEPNRLEAVKASLLEWLKTRRGDRIGLIVMAGDAFVQAPLTNDYTALREVLDQSGPQSLSRGGTNIAGAIEIAASAFAKTEVKQKAIIIVSDGENLEGNAIEAATKAHTTQNISIFTVGVGSEDGGPVPEFTRGKKQDFSKPPAAFVKDEYGVQARSRLDERALRSIATAGGGRFIRFQPDGDIWNALYTQSIQPLARRMETVDLSNYDDLFQIPLIVAILLLAAEMAVSTRLRQPLKPTPAVTLPEAGSAAPATKMKSSPPARGRGFSASASLLAFVFTLATLHGAPEVLSIADAEKMIRDGKADEVAKTLWMTAQQHPEDPYPLYNYGIAAYASGKFNEAIYAFSEVSSCRDEKLRALALTQLGNAQYRLGKNLLKNKNGEGAIIAWERAVEFYDASLKQRKDSVSEHNLAIARNGLEETLIAEGEKALGRGKQTQELNQRASSLTSAFDKFEKALAFSPDNTVAKLKSDEARRLLSETLRDQARELKAKAENIDAAKDKSGEKQKANLKASELYEQAVTIDPNNKELAAEFAEFKKTVANDFVERAEANIAEAAALDEKKGPREPKLMMKEKRLSEAIANTDKALAYDPDNAKAKELKAAALQDLEKTLLEAGDSKKDKGDETSAAGKAEVAAKQYQGALEAFQKADAINPDNATTKAKLAEAQSKLAAELAKVAASEIEKAADALGKASADTAKKPSDPAAAESAGADPSSGAKPDPSKLQSAIGHLEKAAQSAGQSEALDAGKNNASALQKKATEQLDTLRSELDAATAKAGEPGSKGEGDQPGDANGGEGEAGGEGDSTNPPMDGSQTVGPRLGGSGAPLNFSDIRGGSEQEGQFGDKSKKENIRDW